VCAGPVLPGQLIVKVGGAWRHAACEIAVQRTARSRPVTDLPRAVSSYPGVGPARSDVARASGDWIRYDDHRLADLPGSLYSGVCTEVCTEVSDATTLNGLATT
jgi:hypothetical protein